MIISFSLHYKTSWGQVLQLVLDQNGLVSVIDMKYFSQAIWQAECQLNTSDNVTYYYQIKNIDESIVKEKMLPRVLPGYNVERMNLHDTWKWSHGESAFATGIFKDVFFARYNKRTSSDPKTTLTENNTTSESKNQSEITPYSELENQSTIASNILLRLTNYQVESDRYIAITGNQKVLGSWDVSKKVKLDESAYPVWQIELNSADITFPLEYKYLLCDSNTDEVIEWGGGPNRSLVNASLESLTVVSDEYFIRSAPSWKGAGVAIPIFSLRSKKSFGTGEFYDLKLMIDWAANTGQKFIQTLPINDTILYHSNYDSYPYNAVSVFALHPIYLNLDALGKLKDKERKAYFDKKKKELNAKSFSDYQNVMNVKWEYFKEIYALESQKTFETSSYKRFYESNENWLRPYACFSWLRDKFGTPEFGKWPEFSQYDHETIRVLSDPSQLHFQEIALYYFLQYHLHVQLTDVHEYAKKKGIAIKGDIPIGVSPRSVDAWVDPELFNTHMQAGAPPDDFSVTGQNWGFPTYNWELMADDNYRWWQKRFKKLEEYFDAYRIDHILGFFRIWEIPEQDVWGLKGSFNPSLPLTSDELRERGLWWDENRLLKPYMTEHVLHSVFGSYTQEVCREYLETAGWQNYTFKPEYDTQKKVEAHFAALGYNFSNKEVIIRDGLYMLHSEVLFLRDARQPDRFHPRISMHSSATFRDLPDEQRRILDKIYVDYYYHRHNEFWKSQALKKLPALIEATQMLVCGEDLGMVPETVPDVMNELEILSLEIQRMPKMPNHEFAMPDEAPYLSVCTTSTHDMTPIRAWWEEDPHLTQRFYNRALGIQGPAPEKCEAWIAERIVRQHLESPAMLVILPWQDWMSVESDLCASDPFSERINVPSNPRNFWCYRMHMNLEDLNKEKEFNNRLQEMINQAGR